MKLYNCKNCEHNFQGRFCNNCGQKSSVSRVDYKYLIEEISDSIIQMNQGFLYTFKELTIRPGKSIREFLEGKRKQHFKPLGYLVLTSTLYVFLTIIFDLNNPTEDFVTGFQNDMSEMEAGQESTTLTILEWLAKNYGYTLFLILPIFSLASYLAFIKSQYNYFEHLILNAYITGHQMIVYLLMSVVVVKDNFTEVLPFVGSMAFNFWAYYHFFHEMKSYIKIPLSILSYVLFLIMLLVLMFLVLALIKNEL